MKRFFSALWRGWKAFAHKLGVFNTYLILTICYFLVISIAWIIPFLFRLDLLDRRLPREPGSMWKDRTDITPDLENAKRQF